MTIAEKIQGKKLFRLMEQLERDKTMLSMRLVGQNYERLTMITRIPKDKNVSFFAIDAPRDFRSTVANLGTWEIHFNFNGPDHLEYIFTTFGGKFSDNEIQINFPDYIERLQRRRYFRLSMLTAANSRSSRTEMVLIPDRLSRQTGPKLRISASMTRRWGITATRSTSWIDAAA